MAKSNEAKLFSGTGVKTIAEGGGGERESYTRVSRAIIYTNREGKFAHSFASLPSSISVSQS